HFMGVIDTAGINAFEYRELEGKVGQFLYIFGDDFTFATSATPPINNAPILAPIGNPVTDENMQLSVPLTASDSDDGDTVSFSMSAVPAGALFYDYGDGTAEFIWLPDFSQSGSYLVTVTVSDSAIPAATDSETITITVNDVNRPPVLSTIGNKAVDESTELSILLTASDPDGNNLRFVKSGGPTAATLIDHGDSTATFSWTPNFGQAGDYPVTFSVTDDGVPVASGQETITVSVIDPLVDITPPVITLLGITPVAIEAGTTYVDDGATALDNLDGDISASIMPTSTVDSTNAGSYTVTYNVIDTAGNVAVPVVRTVNVTAPVGSLQFSSSNYTVAENGITATITVTRVGGSFGTVGVGYASSDGTATAGTDYTAVIGSLSFADGVTSQSFSITILDDVDYEGDETLNLVLSNPAGGAGSSSTSTSLLRIIEDDVQADDGITGESSSGSIDLITLILLFSLYLRNFRTKNVRS
ncbi:MAG: DUF5011 domain-containing protein, partial [Gammaproteobacteria bacterium]|nr:DUF5011 domain-containing protein [Gammaproteobacteria bacterium]